MNACAFEGCLCAHAFGRCGCVCVPIVFVCVFFEGVCYDGVFKGCLCGCLFFRWTSARNAPGSRRLPLHSKRQDRTEYTRPTKQLLLFLMTDSYSAKHISFPVSLFFLKFLIVICLILFWILLELLFCIFFAFLFLVFFEFGARIFRFSESFYFVSRPRFRFRYGFWISIQTETHVQTDMHTDIRIRTDVHNPCTRSRMAIFVIFENFWTTHPIWEELGACRRLLWEVDPASRRVHCAWMRP